MAFNPTNMQKKAIETKGNVLVAAAAGSGKTAVLVERVIKTLTDANSSVSADRLLIVTFTNAAAAEMKSRIEKRLCDEIDNNPDNVNLLKQKYLLQNADICTIDSFCIKLVRENFEKCGVEPDFKISDGSELVSIENNVMRQLIGEYMQNPSEEFERLLELSNCEYDEKNLTDVIRRVYSYSQQLPFPQKFINELKLPYTTDFCPGNAWYDAAFEIAEKRTSTFKNCLQKMQNAAEYVNKNTEKYVLYADNVYGIYYSLRDALNTKVWDTFAETLQNISFERVPSSDKDDENANIFKDANLKIKEIVKSLKSVFEHNRQITQENIKRYLPAIDLLCEIVTEYSNRLFKAFSDANTYTFYNMEQLALGLLCEYKDGEVIITESGTDLCGRYDEVLVDEFQDVNDLQNMLFYVLSNRENQLFVVGDVKQSIYGFRGSNPDNFLNKKTKYIPVEIANEGDSKKIILSDNFRSRKGVCDAVNFFFTRLMSGQCGNIIYNQEEFLNASGTFPESNAPTAELTVIDRYDDSDGKTPLEAESEKIAEYIISVMQEGMVITDNGCLRNANYGDFAILLNTVKDKANVIAQTLLSYGIPTTLGGDSFLQTTEISTVTSLLQVIDNPERDVELLTVMMSPLFGFTADDMAKIKINQKYGSLYASVVAYAKTGDKKTCDFLNFLAEFRHNAVLLPVDRLVSRLIHFTDILNIMTAMPDGKMRRNNLFLLIKFAKTYAERGNGSLYGFLKYMNSLPETAFKPSVASGSNTVKIMSMHNSKGLQFPVCIVANLSSQINNADSVSRYLFNEKGGIAFKYYDEKSESNVRMLGHTVMADFANEKTVQEKLRLLYVALTRAVDRLCIVCTEKNLESKLLKLSSGLLDEEPYISREFLTGTRNMSDWILSCALLHKNGKKLCDYADVKAPVCDCDFDLKINVINSFSKKGGNTISDIEKPDAECNIALAEKVKCNLNYEYPYEKLRNLQSKVSVSRLVHGAENNRFAFTTLPSFMAGEKLFGAARGTAMHHIMQFINFSENVNVSSEIERLTEWKFITEQEAASADVAAIEKFFNSQLYKRILSSEIVNREMRFLTEILAGRIDDNIDVDLADAEVIVQGAIDLCFVENDGVVVLDFKTDMVDNIGDLVSYYGEQLNIYSTAAEKIFSKPVKEKIIYSFHLGESISF